MVLSQKASLFQSSMFLCFVLLSPFITVLNVIPGDFLKGRGCREVGWKVFQTAICF